jgi:hypothetical protein
VQNLVKLPMSQACRSLDARFQEVRRYCSGPAGGAPRGVQGAKEERCSAGHFMPWSLGGLRDEWPGLVAGAHRSRAGTDVDPGSMASAVGLGVLHTSDPTAESEHSDSDAGVIPTGLPAWIRLQWWDLSCHTGRRWQGCQGTPGQAPARSQTPPRTSMMQPWAPRYINPPTYSSTRPPLN